MQLTAPVPYRGSPTTYVVLSAPEICLPPLVGPRALCAPLPAASGPWTVPTALARSGGWPRWRGGRETAQSRESAAAAARAAPGGRRHPRREAWSRCCAWGPDRDGGGAGGGCRAARGRPREAAGTQWGTRRLGVPALSVGFRLPVRPFPSGDGAEGAPLLCVGRTPRLESVLIGRALSGAGAGIEPGVRVKPGPVLRPGWGRRVWGMGAAGVQPHSSQCFHLCLLPSLQL